MFNAYLVNAFYFIYLHFTFIIVSYKLMRLMDKEINGIDE